MCNKEIEPDYAYATNRIKHRCTIIDQTIYIQKLLFKVNIGF